MTEGSQRHDDISVFYISKMKGQKIIRNTVEFYTIGKGESEKELNRAHR